MDKMQEWRIHTVQPKNWERIFILKIHANQKIEYLCLIIP